jgi:hypothetical protein
MKDERTWVELVPAKTAFEAELLIGALKSAGIPATTYGGQLADEYTMSQALMGQSGGPTVMVPKDLLARAREVLAELRGAG